jgi:signal transduction histidine kinase
LGRVRSVYDKPGTVTGLAKRAPAMLRRHPAGADATLAIVFSAAALVAAKATFEESRRFDASFHPPAMVAVALAILAVTLPLAWRRRFPFTVVITVVVAFVAGRVIVDSPNASITIFAGSLAIYSTAVHGRRRGRTSVLTICVIVLLSEQVRELFLTSSATDLRPLAQSFVLAYNAGMVALPWVLGSVIRSLRERERELGERAAELQREREENAREAVFAERVRIARELHDVVAHHVSVMGVQASAARRVMARQPDRAAEALRSIEESSRQAVLELHRLLRFLRRDGDADGLSPQPGLAQLGELVDEVARGALTVELSVEGEPRLLSPTLEVSAYRVVQEALTNTRKHSGGATATVRVCYGLEALEIEVLDEGSGVGAPQVGTMLDEPASRAGPAGHGLMGMRERTTLHGGHLRAGPRAHGGFAVCATFPLNGQTG